MRPKFIAGNWEMHTTAADASLHADQCLAIIHAGASELQTEGKSA